MDNQKNTPSIDIKNELNFDLNKDTNLSQVANEGDLDDNKLLTKAVWITRLADEHLNLRYSTQELLNCGHSLVEVLDIQSCELIKKYVDEKQILAVAGGKIDILNLNVELRDILLRLASANINSFKNSNNSYSLMTQSKEQSKKILNLRSRDIEIKDYKDLRQAMLNEWMQIKQDFYSL